MAELRTATAVAARASTGPGALSLFALPPAWSRRAACDTDTAGLFHAGDGERGPAKATRERLALGICARCPVRAECLTYAVDTREWTGVWGGTTETQRAALIEAAEKRAEQS